MPKIECWNLLNRSTSALILSLILISFNQAPHRTFLGGAIIGIKTHNEKKFYNRKVQILLWPANNRTGFKFRLRYTFIMMHLQQNPKCIQKEKEWNSISQQVDRIIDSLHEPIDAGIKEVVVGLKAHNVGTMGSCEGHLDRGLPYPWIDVGSPLAEEHDSLRSRFSELWKRHLQEIRREEVMSEEDKQELKEMLEQEIIANEEVLTRFSELLDQYNDLHSTYGPSLVLKKRFNSRARLQPHNMPDGRLKDPKKEFDKLSSKELENNLLTYQDEMKKFAIFLKNHFLK